MGLHLRQCVPESRPEPDDRPRAPTAIVPTRSARISYAAISPASIFPWMATVGVMRSLGLSAFAAYLPYGFVLAVERVACGQ
ncbi:hypothetical protein [Salinilacihabitans rarus]|uniref:hypothetical protein n=1 Tax=Salinilacihabitans rarus TaxID=2961596 RepID=UPI0020C8B37E|nr:hypothetical protein [Salinilacihabitans rarus]